MSNTVESKLERSPEQYMRDRVQLKLQRYTSKSRRWRIVFYTLGGVAALGAVTVPVLVNIDTVPDAITTVLSLVVAAAVAMEGLLHPREHWRNYDLISAELREQEMLYSTRCGPYGGQNSFCAFVTRIEDAISRERAETVVMRTAAPSDAEGSSESRARTAANRSTGGSGP